MSIADKIGLLPGFGWMADHGFWATLAICWALTPVAMIVIALLGESRLLPLSPRYQFLAFFPGDLFLGGMVAGLLVVAGQLPAESHWYNAWWWHVLVLIGAVVVAVVITLGEYNDPDGYGKRAVLSPTKLYHNILLYGGYGYVIVVTLIAVCAWLWGNWSWANAWPVGLSLLMGLVWVAMLVADGRMSNEIDRSRVRYAHVNDWKPIWTSP